jgi:glycosyltransferase involved in cell wall biosynthesis
MSIDANDQSPRISIILPTHNRADVLSFAIRSVLWQTLQDFELLIVGDGCTDHTAEVVRGFDDPRVRWFDLPKAPGFGYANRNIALREARGTFIAFICHDDIWLPDHLALLSACIREGKSEFAYSRSVNVAPDGTMWPGNFNLNHPQCLKDLFARLDMDIPLASVMHTRDCLERYGYWDESLPFAGDRDMWISIVGGGGRRNFSFFPLPTVLKFRPLWRDRDPRWWKRPRIDVYMKLNLLDGILPQQLKVDVPEGMTEQEAVFEVISEDPGKWVAEFRKSIVQLLDARLYTTDDFFPLLLGRLGRQLSRRLHDLWRYRFYRRDRGRLLLNTRKAPKLGEDRAAQPRS